MISKITFEPNDYISFSKNILELLGNRAFYMEVRERGIKKAIEFGITKAVTKLVEIFNSCK